MLLIFDVNNFQQKPLDRFQKKQEIEKDILHKKGSFFSIFIVGSQCSLKERIVFLSLVKKGLHSSENIICTVKNNVSLTSLHVELFIIVLSLRAHTHAHIIYLLPYAYTTLLMLILR